MGSSNTVFENCAKHDDIDKFSKLELKEYNKEIEHLVKITVSHGSINVCRHIFDSTIINVNYQNGTFIRIATRKRDFNMLLFLCERGADIAYIRNMDYYATRMITLLENRHDYSTLENMTYTIVFNSKKTNMNEIKLEFKTPKSNDLPLRRYLEHILIIDKYQETIISIHENNFEKVKWINYTFIDYESFENAMYVALANNNATICEYLYKKYKRDKELIQPRRDQNEQKDKPDKQNIIQIFEKEYEKFVINTHESLIITIESIKVIINKNNSDLIDIFDHAMFRSMLSSFILVDL